MSSLDISLGAPPEHAETAATPNSPTNDRRLPHAAQKLDAARSGRTEQEARPNRARRQSFRSALNTGDDAMPFKRRNAGRGHYYVDEDGTRFDGVTTLLGEGLPKPALVNWAANTTADYAVDHWDELSRNTISERINKLRRARFAERDRAAKRGTEVHTLAERLIRGEEVDVSDELAGHVESYVRFLDEWKPIAVLVETPAANRRWRYAGTLDAVVDMGGRRVLVDIKTSRSGIFPETAYQLAAYAGAEVYLDDDGNEQPMSGLGICDALGIWVRADGYDLYPVDISENTHRTFLHIAHVARQTKDNKRLIGEALAPPEVAA